MLDAETVTKILADRQPRRVAEATGLAYDTVWLGAACALCGAFGMDQSTNQGGQKK